MSYDLIYTNGDSFVAGTGLVQHKYIEDKLYTLDEWKSNYKKIFDKTTIKKIHDLYSSEYLPKNEKENAWPNTLEKITNIKTINDAYHSQSASTIAIKSIESLKKLKKDHKKILALIGTTTSGRIWFPNSGTNSILLNAHSEGRLTKLEADIAEYYLRNSKPEELKNHYDVVFLGLIKFAEKNEIDLYFINHYYSENTDVTKELLIDEIGAEANPELPVFTACGHYPKKYHDNLAYRLKNYFKELQ